MGEMIELDDGSRIDAASQKILIRLREGGWTYTGDLREAAELSQNSQVLYRLEEYLIPAEFVRESDRTREDDPRRFQMTGAGQMWVDNRAETLAHPASREETQEMAYEALQEAQSAKDSVQSYRQKVHTIRDHVDGVDEAVEQAAKEFRSAERSAKHAKSDAREAKSRSRKASNKVEKMDDRLQAVEHDQQQSEESFENRLDAHESAIRDLRQENDELREETERLRSEVDVLREEMDRGPAKRFWLWLMVWYGVISERLRRWSSEAYRRAA